MVCCCQSTVASEAISQDEQNLQQNYCFSADSCSPFFLGGGRSILLSYRDIYEISLILRGFLRFVQGDDLYFRGKIHQKNGHFANGFLPLESNLLKNVLLPRRQKSAEFTTPFEPDFRFQKIIWPVINIFLGGVCSIQLSYWDVFNFFVSLRNYRTQLPTKVFPR